MKAFIFNLIVIEGCSAKGELQAIFEKKEKVSVFITAQAVNNFIPWKFNGTENGIVLVYGNNFQRTFLAQAFNDGKEFLSVFIKNAKLSYSVVFKFFPAVVFRIKIATFDLLIKMIWICISCKDVFAVMGSLCRNKPGLSKKFFVS